MSRENLEVVRLQIEAANRRDWAAVMSAYDEDVVLVASTSVGPDAGVMCGREAVGTWWGDWFRSFGKDYTFDVEDLRSIGDRVLCVARHRGHGRASGVEVEWSTAYVYTVRVAKIVRIELYASRAEALKAAGLEE